MTQTEVLRLALEALEYASTGNRRPEIIGPAMTAIKAALEAKDEPEQMAKLGWQVIDCPICGGGARAFPKQEVKDEPVAHSVVAGALFDFMGWLTSREKRLILSSVDEASPAVEAITEFAIKRNLSLKYAEVGYWTEFLATPPQQEAKDEPVAWYVERQHLGFRDHGLKYGPFWKLNDAIEWCDNSHVLKELYATPPQRKPLTDETRNWIVATCPTPRHIIDAVERMHGIKGEA